MITSYNNLWLIQTKIFWQWIYKFKLFLILSYLNLLLDLQFNISNQYLNDTILVNRKLNAKKLTFHYYIFCIADWVKFIKIITLRFSILIVLSLFQINDMFWSGLMNLNIRTISTSGAPSFFKELSLYKYVTPTISVKIVLSCYQNPR